MLGSCADVQEHGSNHDYSRWGFNEKLKAAMRAVALACVYKSSGQLLTSSARVLEAEV